MEALPKFSVIIPTYNRLGLLKQTLESVWKQTFRAYELIVIDDGSTDGTWEYLASLIPSTKVLRQENWGPGAARNLGAKHAIGKYLAFLDSDDLWFPWTLATLHEVIQLRQPTLICGAVSEFQGEVPIVCQSKLSTEHFYDYFDAGNSYRFFGCSGFVVKRETFERLGGFDEEMYVAEDLDFLLRSGLEPGFVQVHSPVTTVYRRHTGNTSTHLEALIVAANDLLHRESKGHYPGGQARRKQRWRLLTRTLRPIIVSAFTGGLAKAAWQLYWRSFHMNAQLLRFRFLAAAPLVSRGRPTGTAGVKTLI